MFTLREVCLKRARESQKCQADINKRYALIAHINGSVLQLKRVQSLKTMRTETLISVCSHSEKSHCCSAFPATNFLSPYLWTFLDQFKIHFYY